MEMSGLLPPLAFLFPGKKIAVPHEQEIELATDMVWTLWRRKSVMSLPAI
jgi:hypothetical protein